jgi:uncharacterized protein involved in exopolysaccharide biosynthesis
MSDKPIEPLQPFRLSSGEKESNAWQRIAKRTNDRISKLQKQLEDDQPEVSTARTRGRIAELRLLLSAADDELPPITDQ